MLDVRLRGASLYKLVLSVATVAAIIYIYNKVTRKPPDILLPEEKVRVDVYYECLCPDSRSFILHELVPAWDTLKEIMEVNLIPYGKATTEKEAGVFKFSCQHGPTECQGNLYHACAVKDSHINLSLPYVSCMMENNMDPPRIAETCAQKLKVPFAPIAACATGSEGNQLGFLMGELTNQLSPAVTFIPTVEIEKSQKRFREALKNLSLQVCLEFKDKYHKIYPKCRDLLL